MKDFVGQTNLTQFGQGMAMYDHLATPFHLERLVKANHSTKFFKISLEIGTINFLWLIFFLSFASVQTLKRQKSFDHHR